MAKVGAAVKVTGRVQGVWFRQSTKQTAQIYGVCGWVRNCPDGSVEAVFEGEEPAVHAVIDWCRSGPELARVADLQIAWQPTTGYTDFRVR